MKKTYFLAGTAILFWSTMATISKLLLGSLDQYQVLCISGLLAGLALLAVNLATGRIRVLRHCKAKDWLIMIGTGLLGNFFYYICYYGGAARMPASQAFIVNYLWPIMSVVFACILLKEKLTPRKILAIALSFLGIFAVAGADLLSFDVDILTGAALCALGAVFYGAFTALNKKWNYDMHIAMMLSFFAASLLSLPLALVSGASWALNGFQWAGLAWNGLCTMAVANTCWVLAINRGSTVKVSNLAYITPFLSLVWIFLFLREPFSLWSVVGLCIIVLGILIQLREKTKTSA